MPKYELKTKAQIIKKIQEGAKIILLSQEYGISPQTIYRWKKNFRVQDSKPPLNLTLTEQEEQLLAENLTVPLSSSRLLLRQFRLTDYQDVYNNWASSPEVTRYLRWDAHQTPQASLDYLRYRLDQYRFDKYNLSWVVILKTTNEPIGEISLVDVDANNHWCEIGYVYGQKYWRQGYASEALLCVLPYLKQIGFTQIVSSALKLNVGSAKVLIKCGFTFIEEVTTTEHDRLNGTQTTLLKFQP
jgi:ribosomal-protein-alanine N-acetyltransferase